MAITVTQAYIDTFESNVRQLAQQNRSYLRSKVTEVNKQSEAHNWERLAASSARAKTSARMVSPAGGSGSGAVGATDGLTWTRRKTSIATYDTGEVVEREDIVQTLINPKSAVTRNLVMNMGRQVDDIIIAAATGNATDGAGSPVAFPSAQGIGGATTLFTLDTVLEATEVLDKADVDPDEPRCFVISPTIKRKMLQTTEFVSGDYQAAKALASGYLPNYMGYDWIVSNRLTVPTTGDVYCLAFTPKALGLHVAGDISTRVAERPDMSFAWQIYLDLHMAAVRVEDEHIVRVHLKDAIS